MILRYVLTIIALSYLINCSGNSNKKNLSNQEEFNPPEIQYTEAMLMFDNRQYELASEKFKNIERIYPLSNEAIQSQIMQGFINYILLDYDTAIFQFSRICIIYLLRGNPTRFAPTPNPAPCLAYALTLGAYKSSNANVAAAVTAIIRTSSNLG